MAKRKPSERRNFKEEGMELNLVPMMNLVSILIPALLISAAFIEISVINVAAPAIGSAPEQEQQQDKPDKPPLNLTVTITDKGYTVAGSGGVLGGEQAAGEEQSGPTIPIIQKTILAAVANARQHDEAIGLQESDFVVSEIRVDEGPTQKRIRARAQGRAFRIRKRTSHIKVVVAAGVETDAAADE